MKSLKSRSCRGRVIILHKGNGKAWFGFLVNGLDLLFELLGVASPHDERQSLLFGGVLSLQILLCFDEGFEYGKDDRLPELGMLFEDLQILGAEGQRSIQPHYPFFFGMFEPGRRINELGCFGNFSKFRDIGSNGNGSRIKRIGSPGKGKKVRKLPLRKLFFMD